MQALGYASQFKQNIHNPFWKDVHQNWTEFCNDIKIESVNHVLESPLWNNKHLINGVNFCIQDWYNKRIRLVSDINDEQGNVYQFEDLKEKYNLCGTFFRFQSFLRKIPENCKTVINDNKIMSYNVRCNVYVQYLLKDKKGCRRLYDVMVPTKLLQQSTKWEHDVGNISEAEMKL